MYCACDFDIVQRKYNKAAICFFLQKYLFYSGCFFTKFILIIAAKILMFNVLLLLRTKKKYEHNPTEKLAMEDDSYIS